MLMMESTEASFSRADEAAAADGVVDREWSPLLFRDGVFGLLGQFWYATAAETPNETCGLDDGHDQKN